MLAGFREYTGHDPAERRAFDELATALAPKVAKPWATTKKLKAKKKSSKRAETSSLRERASARADGICECGCGQPLNYAEEMDHFWGRGKAPQTLENCWMLNRLCHRLKTEGKPGPAAWLEKFRGHCIRNDYMREAAKAGIRLDAIDLMKQAQAVAK